MIQQAHDLSQTGSQTGVNSTVQQQYIQQQQQYMQQISNPYMAQVMSMMQQQSTHQAMPSTYNLGLSQMDGAVPKKKQQKTAVPFKPKAQSVLDTMQDKDAEFPSL